MKKENLSKTDKETYLKIYEKLKREHRVKQSHERLKNIVSL